MPSEKDRRPLRRKLGQRRYRKLFVIAVEGAKTEPLYFGIFQRFSVILVKCLGGKHDSSPSGVLKRMKEFLRTEALEKSDEAWLVVDKDHWKDDQLDELEEWAGQEGNFHFALSNPNFEYWLLLHFEEGTGIEFASQVKQRLRTYLPYYDKSLDSGKIDQSMIEEAICRAKARNSPGDSVRSGIGKTSVWKLVENILSAGKH
jgi:hypothetical protein